MTLPELIKKTEEKIAECKRWEKHFAKTGNYSDAIHEKGKQHAYEIMLGYLNSIEKEEK